MTILPSATNARVVLSCRGLIYVSAVMITLGVYQAETGTIETWSQNHKSNTEISIAPLKTQTAQLTQASVQNTQAGKF